jgi:Methyltransferase domain
MMMSNDRVPEPSVMPVNRQEWGKQLNISNFINAYYQYKDIQSLEKCKEILIVGPGQGLERAILNWRGYAVTTLDIDSTFSPDYIGSVHDLNMFSSGQFDAVIASHVLEHLAVPYLDAALKELSRVSRNAIIYLPIFGKHFQWRFMTGGRKIDISIISDVYNWFIAPDGVSPRYMAGQHFWEVGMRGFKTRDLKKRFSSYFRILRTYRNRDWLASMNFILKSKWFD